MIDSTPEGSPPAPGQTDRFDWPLAFDAENLLRQHVETFLQHNGFARQLRQRMRQETGTDFFEWIDHIALPVEAEAALRGLGFTQEKVDKLNGELVLEHPRATLPRVVIEKGLRQNPARIALRVESVADFVAAHWIDRPIEGAPYSRLRRVSLSRENDTLFEVLERSAYRGFVPAPLHPADLKNIVQAKDSFRSRVRHGATESQGFQSANETVDAMAKVLGEDLTCQLFFDEERRYWESRNRAGQIQKRRQNRLGLGWGNHDHHTYRCSRGHFVDVIQFLLRLDFEKRERYYAGAQAGWGAQICEQPNVGIVVFADVDLMPEEVEIDFSSLPLGPAPRLGTVGLWVGLHGESFLQAGMHHLEARFDFDALRRQLCKEGVQIMKPFSNFRFLRQAFTEGERWPVDRDRVEKLREAGFITARHARKFLKEGALGSHLENLQRRGGFKGFNQQSVSAIISATDPRKHFQPAAA
jgi:hypothetical protein